MPVFTATAGRLHCILPFLPPIIITETKFHITVYFLNLIIKVQKTGAFYARLHALFDQLSALMFTLE